MDKITQNTIPNFYSAVVLIFPEEASKTRIVDVIHEFTDFQIYENSVEIVYQEIKNFYSWEVKDEAFLVFIMLIVFKEVFFWETTTSSMKNN